VGAAHLVLADVDLSGCLFTGTVHADQLLAASRKAARSPPSPGPRPSPPMVGRPTSRRQDSKSSMSYSVAGRKSFCRLQMNAASCARTRGVEDFTRVRQSVPPHGRPGGSDATWCGGGAAL
jgi:hypothetical protein